MNGFWKQLNNSLLQSKPILYLRKSLRFSFLILIFLSLLPGLLLAIYSFILNRQYELTVVLVIGICALTISWFGIERLILRRIKELNKLSKRLAAGDLSARSGQSNSIGLIGELSHAFDQMADSLERQTHQIQTRANQVAVLSELASEIAVERDISVLQEKVLEKVMKLLNTSQAALTLYDLAAGDLVVTAEKGLQIPIGMRIKLGEGAIGRAAQTRQPVVMDDSADGQDLGSDFPVSPDSTVVQIPMAYRGELVGVLGVTISTSAFQDNLEVQLMTTLAEMAGNAIHRIQLHEQTVKQLKRLSALHQIDLAITSSLDLKYSLQILLDQVITQLGVDAACALTYNPHDQALEYAASRGFTTDALHHTRVPLGQGYAGLAAKEQRTIYVADLNTRTTDFLRSPSFSAEGFVGYYAVPLVVRSQIKGVLEVFHRSRLENDLEWLAFLEALASQAAIAIENAFLYRDLQQSNMELNWAYDATLEGWSRALDLRDEDTEGHTQRVTEITLRLARAIGVSDAELIFIRWGAMLHDIGKLGVPDRILLKSGPLTEEEWAIMRRHPIYAQQLLSPITYLRSAIDVPYCHHEKWDGSGYPRGLKGKEIPLSARIFSVVDVWDALRSDRPYRKGWPENQVRAYLREQAGYHFDPKAVDTFLSILSAEDDTSGGEYT